MHDKITEFYEKNKSIAVGKLELTNVDDENLLQCLRQGWIAQATEYLQTKLTVTPPAFENVVSINLLTTG